MRNRHSRKRPSRELTLRPWDAVTLEGATIRVAAEAAARWYSRMRSLFFGAGSISPSLTIVQTVAGVSSMRRW
jgi:hypothetical protein